MAKRLFFCGLSDRSRFSYVHMDVEADAWTFNVSRQIHDNDIGQLLFRNDDELAATRDNNQEKYTAANRSRKASMLNHNAMSLLIQHDDRTYRAVIRNAVRFRLSIAHVSVELSFHQDAAVTNQTCGFSTRPNLGKSQVSGSRSSFAILLALLCRASVGSLISLMFGTLRSR